MVSCEMCGAETSSPKTVKIEGAELEVCDDCTDFGTEVQTGSSGSTSTKYSTGSSESSSSSGSSSSGGGTTGAGRSGGGGGQSDMYDDIEELAQDYDERLREAREAAGLSQEDLAKQLNEKASLIRKLEHGDILPSDEVQQKLERALEVDLGAGGSAAGEEWSGGSSTGEYTLGDVVERKDS